MQKYEIKVDEKKEDGSLVYVAEGGKFLGLIVVAVIGLALFKKSTMVFVDCRLFTNFVATKQVVLGFNFLTGLLIAIWRTEN